MHISHDFIATKTCPSYEFLVVFGQVRVWDRKSAGQVRVRSVRGGCRPNFSNSCVCGGSSNFAGRVRAQNFNPRRTLLPTALVTDLINKPIKTEAAASSNYKTGKLSRSHTIAFTKTENSPDANYRAAIPQLWSDAAVSQVSTQSGSAGFRGGPRGPGPSPPTKKGPPTMFMCLAIWTTCACHLFIFINEESLFAGAIKLSVIQTAVFHLYIIWYCDETTITLIVFLEICQVSESRECKAKPRRAH